MNNINKLVQDHGWKSLFRYSVLEFDGIEVYVDTKRIWVAFAPNDAFDLCNFSHTFWYSKPEHIDCYISEDAI